MAEGKLQVVVVSPERALLDTTADFVALPLYDGEMGILPGRAPLIGRLGAGELRIKRGNETLSYYVDGGFVQVRDNVVSLLTSKAQALNEINTTAALQVLEHPPEKQPPEERIQNQNKARIQLRLAKKVA